MATYREIASAKLGRALHADEIVHHINGDHGDDRPENLMVLTSREHAAVHEREMRAAREKTARSVEWRASHPFRSPRWPFAVDYRMLPSLIDAVRVWRAECTRGEGGDDGQRRP